RFSINTNYATACLCVRPLQDCRSRDWGQFGVTVRDGGRWTRAGDRRWGSSGAARAQVYEGAFRGARDEPERFWGEAARGVSWFTSWEKTLDCSHPAFPRWFVGGELNMCYNAVDRHVESGRGEQPAIIHDSPVTGSKQIFTYREVQDEVSRLAGVLVKHGVRKGDLVVIYMPMVPQAMFTMLACARIGAPHSLIFGGFASKELSVRIDHAKPKLLVTASFGVEPGRRVEYIPLVEKALELSSHKPHKVLIYNRPGMVRPFSPARPTNYLNNPALHPDTALPTQLPLIHFSKTHTHTHKHTGKPVGTPDPGAFFRVMSEHGTASVFTGPSAIRAIRQQDPQATHGKRFPLNSLRTLFVAGERCDAETLEWAKKNFRVPVLDHWWQTETGSPITASCIGLGNSLAPPVGTTGKPVPGYNITVIDDEMQPVKPRSLGNIVVKLPLPPGNALSLWQNPELFEELYFTKFPGYYDTMDAGYIDEEGFVYIMSRSDDVINVSGHRLSSGALEESVLQHPAVVDCAVVALEDSLKGHVPLALCVLRNDCQQSKDVVVKELVGLVRDSIGPVAAFRKVLFVTALPKTRSGKIPRSTLAKLVNGKSYKVPSFTLT
uniref:Acyl-CoA synthetase short-chain family member 3, mitochondrial n=1 Tax=Astyanax mexicanus TaxID=7994 RepID=A0A8B9KXZ5_ASTMX